jgi:hypothetical protein
VTRSAALLLTWLIPAAAYAQQPQRQDMSTMMIDPLGISMERLGSGTTWIPDAVPLPARHKMAGSWLLMLHGFVFVQYDAQSGLRGDDQFGSLNWAMLMASRNLLGGRLQLRTMLSLDPATVTTRGYPLLLQSGETSGGQPLHDRQHPHDFWMELAGMYERALSPGLGFSLYVAPSGEPALSPVAFMHRPSAMDNLAAPLGHHWQDATHISFGVFTAGILSHHWKLEGSIFNGREPDEERWGFDAIKLDSYSGRFSAHLDSSWTFSVGYGYLKSPEALHPEESTHRTTASVLYGKKLGSGQIASAVIWGANRTAGQTTHSWLFEIEAITDRANTIYGRAEVVEKTGEDLQLGSVVPGRVGIGSLTGGYIRELVRGSKATLGIGIQGTVNTIPGSIAPFYGSSTPVGGMLFLRVRPLHGAHTMGGMTMPMDH